MAKIPLRGEERLHEGVAALLHQRLQRGVQCVVVFLDEMSSLVADCTSKVADEKAIVIAEFAVLL